MAGRGTKKLTATEGLPRRHTLKDRVFSSALYTGSLKNRTPKRLLFTPADIIAGDSEGADTLFKGIFELEGLANKKPLSEPWMAKGMPLYWHNELHRFNWVRDFSANGSDAARRHVRALVAAWITSFEDYQPYIWDPAILARRLINWMQQSAFLLTSNDGDLNYKFLKSLRKQHQHLARYCRYLAKEPDQFELYLALYLGSACFSDTQEQTPRFEQKLLGEIGKNTLADGCHISRNPTRQLAFLTDLVSLRDSYGHQGRELPEALMLAIDQLTPTLRFFQHGDGSLALFNGGQAAEEGRPDHILLLSKAMGRPPYHLPHGGFERLKAGRSLVLIETGQKGRPRNQQIYAGLGSFEFSHGRDRLIVNCGAHPDEQSPWHKALAASAAHSTLSIGAKNMVFPATVAPNDPDPVPVQTHEEGGNLWFEMDNPGYEPSLGITHTRRLFLTADGTSLKGEDRVQASMTGDTITDFILRFHIHPDVSISKSMGGRSFLMMTKSGSGWQFITSLSDAGLEESIYCSQPGETRTSRQITLKGRLHGAEPLTIKWALHKSGNAANKSD